MKPEMNQNRAMREVQEESFAVYEAVLYLDGHPDDRRALRYYAEHKARREAAISRYEKKYGPMTVCGVESTDRWTWVDDPWPWEYDSTDAAALPGYKH